MIWFRNKYRIKLLNDAYVPQVRRWWSPFWNDLRFFNYWMGEKVQAKFGTLEKAQAFCLSHSLGFVVKELGRLP